MHPIAISTRALTRDFPNVRAVDNLTIDVPGGSVYGFLGPNGSGKTTTIRLLLGLLEPTSGQAEVLGLDTRSQSDAIRRQCGALLEYTGLYDRLSAWDNLEFYGRAWKMEKTERNRRIEELLTGLGLWQRREEQTAGWSRGMRQKLGIARALLHKPELLFLDEPTAGLDPVAAAALHEDLANLAHLHGVTVFLTTHNLAEAEKLCTRIGVLRNGRLVATGTPDELRRQASGGTTRAEILVRGISEAALAAIRNRPEVIRAGLEQDRLVVDLVEGTDLAPLVSQLVAGGGLVEEVRKEKANLEEVFLTLVEEEKK